MKTVARVFLVVVAVAVLGALVVGLWDLAERKGVWVALMVFPGIPLGAAVMLLAVAFAVDDEA